MTPLVDNIWPPAWMNWAPPPQVPVHRVHQMPTMEVVAVHACGGDDCFWCESGCTNVPLSEPGERYGPAWPAWQRLWPQPRESAAQGAEQR